jgi:hypothetical protein
MHVAAPSITLGLQLDGFAAKAMCAWDAHPPDKALDLRQVCLAVGDRAGVDRRVEWHEFTERQRKAKRTVSGDCFFKQANISRTQFYESWLGYKWSDDSTQGQLILELLARPLDSWPQDKPRFKRNI